VDRQPRPGLSNERRLLQKTLFALSIHSLLVVAHIKTTDEYFTMHRHSTENPERFWTPIAEQFLWDKKVCVSQCGAASAPRRIRRPPGRCFEGSLSTTSFPGCRLCGPVVPSQLTDLKSLASLFRPGSTLQWDKVLEWDFRTPSIKWFEGGKLNVRQRGRGIMHSCWTEQDCANNPARSSQPIHLTHGLQPSDTKDIIVGLNLPYCVVQITVNCLDRHVAAGFGNRPALTFEADDGASETYSYKQVLDHVCATAQVLEANGVRAGDRVALYMPMVPQVVFTMLACARMGAVHTTIFGGFSAEAVAERIVNAQAEVVVTADAGVRGGRVLPLKQTVDTAIVSAASRGVTVRRVLVHHRAGRGVAEGSAHWTPGRDVSLDSQIAEVMRHTLGRGEPAVTYTPASVGAEDPLFLLYTSGWVGSATALAGWNHIFAGR